MSNINRRGGYQYQSNNNRNLPTNASLPALNSNRGSARGYGRKSNEGEYVNKYQNKNLKAPPKAQS